MVPPCSDRIPRVPPYLSYIQYLQWFFGYTAITLCGWLFQVILLNHQISYTGSSAFARHYLRNLGWFLFLRVLRWFSSPGSLLCNYVFIAGYCINTVGFPIRISLDHRSFANSPTLFAGLHVLLRLSSPRHPPDALIHLTLSFQKPSTYPLSIRFDFNLLTDGSFHNKVYCLLCR